MSHDHPTAGYDPLAAPQRDAESSPLKWPVLAQLPWVGEVDEQVAAAPADILPFADETPRPFAPPLLDESELPVPQLRIVDAALPIGEQLAAHPPYDRRLHSTAANAQHGVEPPHLNFHRFPSADAASWAPDSATASEATIHGEALNSQAPPRQHRRFDPPQPRLGDRLTLHEPTESFAAQFYRWHTARTPRFGLAVIAALTLAAGGIYFSMFGRTVEPAPAIAAPPDWTVKPIPSAAGGEGQSIAAPLPVTPPLDLSSNDSNTKGTEPAVSVSQAPPKNVAVEEQDDPVAKWLNSQPITTFKQPVSSEALREETSPPAPTPAEAAETVAPVPAAASATDNSIVPTPASPSLTLSSPYPVTSYPPFDFSLALPSAMSTVAETPGAMFAPPQPPR